MDTHEECTSETGQQHHNKQPSQAKLINSDNSSSDRNRFLHSLQSEPETSNLT